MRPARIAAQIGPVGIGRVQHARGVGAKSAPRAAPREWRAPRLGQRIAGIGGEIFLITLERIALDAGGVSVSRPNRAIGFARNVASSLGAPALAPCDRMKKPRRNY